VGSEQGIKLNDMEIENCSPADIPQVLALYEAARNLQTEKGVVVWPYFESDFIQKEIEERRQWKITEEDVLACNWAITFNDKEIWEERDKDDGIYIHRVCTHPAYRGKRYMDTIVDWAKNYALQNGKSFVRLDTLGNNTKLIEHYTSAGFRFLGISRLTNTASLPKHYQDERDCCLFEMRVG
jgi:ribosomal protein S18 acetylase RimI-like enzyme